MSEARPAAVPFLERDLWDNSLASQFSASLYKFTRQRDWPRLDSSPAHLAESIIEQAEERAEKPLDHSFLKIAILALNVQTMTTAIQNLVAECSAVCRSPIEMAMCFALAIAGREGERGVSFSFGDTSLGDTAGDMTLV